MYSFGNLIDNAVEACERIVEPGRKKFIVLNVNIKKDYLFIDIANSFTGEVKKQNNIYRTVKIDERYCGIYCLISERLLKNIMVNFQSAILIMFLVFLLCCHYSGEKIRTAVLTAVLIFL